MKDNISNYSILLKNVNILNLMDRTQHQNISGMTICITNNMQQDTTIHGKYFDKQKFRYR